MNTADYYYEIAYHVRDIADEYEPTAREAMHAGETDALFEQIEEQAESHANHSAFREELGNLWTIATFDATEAAFMREIIEASTRGRFCPEVEGPPSDALRQAAAATIKHDIERGANDLLAKRLADDGFNVRRL